MQKKFLGVAAGALLIPAASFALTFAEIDTDGDGSATIEEVTAALPDASPEAVTALDADGDGAISEMEFDAMPQ